jgi:hypothetical protein
MWIVLLFDRFGALLLITGGSEKAASCFDRPPVRHCARFVIIRFRAAASSFKKILNLETTRRTTPPEVVTSATVWMQLQHRLHSTEQQQQW